MDLTLQDTDNSWKDLTVQEKRDKLMELHNTCNSMEQLDIPVQEIFCDGVYIRHGLLKAGTVIVGEIHKRPQVNIISSGKIRVVSEEGSETISAPHIFISPAGAKRVGFVIEDTTWSTIHGCTEMDPVKRRAHFVADSYEDYEKYLEVTNVGSNSSNGSGDSRVNHIPSKRTKKGTEAS